MVQFDNTGTALVASKSPTTGIQTTAMGALSTVFPAPAVITSKSAQTDYNSIKTQTADLNAGITTQQANVKAAQEAAAKAAADKAKADQEAQLKAQEAARKQQEANAKSLAVGGEVKKAYDTDQGNQLLTDAEAQAMGLLSKNVTSNSYLDDALAKKQKADEEYQIAAKQAMDTITGIQNGSVPLNPGQIAQIDGLKAQFQQLIDQQNKINSQAEGVGQMRGYQKGAAEYDPTFQAKTIGSIISTGAAKVADLNTKMATAVAQLTSAFQDDNIKGVQAAWSLYQDAAEKREKSLTDTIERADAQIKEAQDAMAAADKTYYDQVMKPIQDIQADVLKNTGNSELAALIGQSGSVSEALYLAGDSLQTATGDLGAYLFSRNQAQAAGYTYADYDTWQEAMDKRKLDSEMAKLRLSEGIKFDYNKALEEAKQAMANAPTPNYNGEFANTIKLAAQAGTTNAQRSQIKSDMESFIAEGDYDSAYTQVLSSASAKLTGANASTFQERVKSYGAIKDMREALKAFQDAGGNTNLFKGGADAIQTRIGVLMTDPKYAAIAVQLNSAFQQYRQDMTGAAFGAQESAEYSSVIPSPKNTFALNMAKIDGAEAYLNSVVENTLKQTVGQGGINIKNYAEANQDVQKTQADSSAKVQELYSAHQSEIDSLIELRPDISDEEILQILGY